MGIAILPETAMDKKREPELFSFEIADLISTNRLYLVYNIFGKLSPAAAAFLDFMHGTAAENKKGY